MKTELVRRRSTTALLGVFTERTCAPALLTPSRRRLRKATDRDEVRRRLLLYLYGPGANAGLMRLVVGGHGFSYAARL